MPGYWIVLKVGSHPWHTTGNSRLKETSLWLTTLNMAMVVPLCVNCPNIDRTSTSCLMMPIWLELASFSLTECRSTVYT